MLFHPASSPPLKVGAILIEDGEVDFEAFFTAFFAVMFGALGIGQVRTAQDNISWPEKRHKARDCASYTFLCSPLRHHVSPWGRLVPFPDFFRVQTCIEAKSEGLFLI